MSLREVTGRTATHHHPTMIESKAARLFDFLRISSKTSPSSEKADLQETWRLMQGGQYEAAEQACRKILRRKPRHVEANHCLGALHQRAKRHEQAIARFEKVLAVAPNNVPAHANLADSLGQLGRFDEATAVIDRALTLRPDSPAAWRTLGHACFHHCRYADGANCFRKALEAEPDDIRNHVGLAANLRRLGHAVEALAHYDRALSLQPDDPQILASRGNVLSYLGRLDDAAAAYRKSIRLRPDSARTHELLASVRKHIRYDAELKAMETLYHRPANAPEDRMILAFGLGKAYEELKDYDKAFAFFLEANRLRRSITSYSIADDERLFAQLKATLTAEFFARHQGLGSDDPTPIFILGMPRSGTSLVEQILSSHPLVYGGGELPDMEIACKSIISNLPEGLERLAPDDWRRLADRYLAGMRTRNDSRPFITDKMPANFMRIGMIVTMLSKAKIIHCRRDPLDTCLSAFKSFFATSGMQWCYDLTDTGRYYRLYHDLMAHWHRVLPGRMHDVQYEDLVANPEREIRRLLDACGLDFHANCLAFHRSKRPVATRSFAQIRQPIYASAVQSWRRYERHLQPLMVALGEPTSGAA